MVCPKVMISAVANGLATFGPFVGIRDIMILHSVADVLGLNAVTRRVLAEGVGAVIGMVVMDYGSDDASKTGCGADVGRGYDALRQPCP